MGRDSSYKKPTDKILTVPVNLNLHTRIRIAAAERQVSLKEFCTTAIQEFLMKHEDNKYNGNAD